MAEISFVMKAISTLVASLKKASSENPRVGECIGIRLKAKPHLTSEQNYIKVKALGRCCLCSWLNP